MRLEEAVSTSSGGVAWPVVIIGGLIIVAGLVAVRVEFANWRQRRAERSRRS
jgi:membrane-associated phospholipid phosphatase